METTTTALLEHLRALEVSLHQPAVRSDATRLDALLHDAFSEFGRSGRIFSRADILQQLLKEQPTFSVWSQEFSVERIAEGIALLTYKSAHVDTNGGMSQHTLRTSLWQHTSDGWKVRFHQGTPTDAFAKAHSAQAPRIHTRIDDLSSREAQALVAEHLAGMHGNSPPGNVNALAIDALREPDITFWTAWSGADLCGCGALKDLTEKSGEVKSMRTRPAFLRRGVAKALLTAIEDEARARGYRQLHLETGTGPAFEPAHAFYLRNGFDWCGAFADYEATDFNVFMQKEL